MNPFSLTGAEDEPVLVVNGDAHYAEDDGVFELRAATILEVALQDLPRGTSVRLCDKVIGSRDLVARTPYCSFQHTPDGRLLAHVEVPFVPDVETTTKEEVEANLRGVFEHTEKELHALAGSGIVAFHERRVYDEIAYELFTVVLQSQSFGEAEAYLGEIEDRLHNGSDRRSLLFICHASEDKAFVRRLVRALERRAEHVWFDEREILVGDSIVDRINEALSSTRFVLAVLSPNSVTKPWVMRELNSTLMRQLANEGIRVLPVVIAPCQVPPLLADIKYADFRGSFAKGLRELISAMRASTGTGPTAV
jgi:hypothetical protein